MMNTPNLNKKSNFINHKNRKFYTENNYRKKWKYHD